MGQLQIALYIVTGVPEGGNKNIPQEIMSEKFSHVIKTMNPQSQKLNETLGTGNRNKTTPSTL